MNHNWANQYSRDRYAQLAREAQGDLLIKMADLPKRPAHNWSPPAAFTRLRAKAHSLITRTVTSAARVR